MIPLSDICAIMCNYARPISARQVVGNLRELGVDEIIVCNNAAEPIPGATRNINHPKNIGPVARWMAASETERPWILLVDDDKLLKHAGLDALREWAGQCQSAVGLQGYIIKPPFDWYRKRNWITAWKLQSETPVEVDHAWPGYGMMLRTELCRAVPDEWAWRELAEYGEPILPEAMLANYAIQKLSGQRPMIVPLNEIGSEDLLPDENPAAAIAKQPGMADKNDEIYFWLRMQRGWRPIRMEEQ